MIIKLSKGFGYDNHGSPQAKNVLARAKIEFEEKLKGTESYYHAVHT